MSTVEKRIAAWMAAIALVFAHYDTRAMAGDGLRIQPIEQRDQAQLFAKPHSTVARDN